MIDTDRLKLQADCNSLNAIAGYLRNCGKHGMSANLLSIEKHIFEMIEKECFTYEDLD